jgi:uncharacterized protein (TIGR03435 family)
LDKIALVRRAILILGCLVACGAAFGQAVGTRLEFEEASVRPASKRAPETSEIHGGPGTAEPSRFTATYVSLQELLILAYDLPPDQISGPSWLTTEPYDVVAKVAAGVTPQQLQEMFQNLLKDRFKMTVHFAKKDFAVYAMTVAKGGPKIEESAIDPNAPPLALGPDGLPVAGPLTFTKDGFPEIPPGNASIVRGINLRGHELIAARQQSPVQIAKILQDGMGPENRVVDETGLTGKYDFHLRYSQPRPPETPAQFLPPGVEFLDTVRQPAPDVVTAAEDQLGLTLKKGKVAMDVLVIDRAEKTPVEN